MRVLAVGDPGWLERLTNWLGEMVATVFGALVDLVKDFVLFAVRGVLDLVLAIVNAIPVPDFLSQYSICTLLANAGPTAAWAVGTFKIAECLSVLMLAVSFRLLRKLLTLFQW